MPARHVPKLAQPPLKLLVLDEQRRGHSLPLDFVNLRLDLPDLPRQLPAAGLGGVEIALHRAMRRGSDECLLELTLGVTEGRQLAQQRAAARALAEDLTGASVEAGQPIVESCDTGGGSEQALADLALALQQLLAAAYERVVVDLEQAGVDILGQAAQRRGQRVDAQNAAVAGAQAADSRLAAHDLKRLTVNDEPRADTEIRVLVSVRVSSPGRDAVQQRGLGPRQRRLTGGVGPVDQLDRSRGELELQRVIREAAPRRET